MAIDKRPPTDYSVIIDAHAHLGRFRNFHIPAPDAAGLVRSMDSYGIDVAVISAHAAISADIVRGNDETLAAISSFPDRLLGYCVVNPNYPELAEREIEKCFAHPLVRGFKFHPELHGDYPVDGPGYQVAWKFANAHRLPVLSHTYFAGDSLETFARLTALYPEAILLLGHAGQDFDLEDVVSLVQRRPNVVLDLCGALSAEGALETLVSRVGPERLLFGTDMPFMSGGRQLGTIATSRLERSVKEVVLGSHAARLFRVEGLNHV